MLSVHLLNYEPERVGGGWTFSNSLVKGMGDKISTYEEAQICFIASPTMASHEEVERAKADGKKLVLRIDNAVLDSRNRGTGMSRMKSFADMADLIIYQSKWARDYLYPFTQKDGTVILNGADTSIFKPEGRTNEEVYLYSRFNRDESKGWHMARYWFSRKWQEDQSVRLNILGKFSPENLEYGFDFYQGENYSFLGVQPFSALPDIYRSSKYFLYSYWNDACSNSLIEARQAGLEIIDVGGMLQTGGAPEIMECEDLSIDRMVKEYEAEIGKLL